MKPLSDLEWWKALAKQDLNQAASDFSEQGAEEAVEAGGIEVMPVANMFWGDRAGSIKDPFGYSWMIATHQQDLTQEQIRKGAEVFFAQMAKK